VAPAAVLRALALVALVACFGAAPLVVPADGGAPWGDDARASLRSDLDALFAAAPGIRGAHAGLVAVDARDGSVLYERLADDEFVPASALKLVVGSAALATLRLAFAFHTVAFATGPTSAGVLHGALLLRGGGDPLLGATDLDALAAALASSGVRHFAFEGSPVQIDSSYFDDRPYPDGWVWDDFPYAYAAPVSATSYLENAVRFTVTGGAMKGEPARVVASPAASVAFDAACPARAARPVRVIPLATTGPAGSDSTVDVARVPGGCIEVLGSVAAGSSDTIDAAVVSPRAYLADAVRAALRRNGIDAGSPSESLGDDEPFVAPPAGAVLRTVWTHDSQPLPKLLATMWRDSDNLLAECLLKNLAVESGVQPGTTDDGVAAEFAYLKALGVTPESVALRDGSGLSTYDRITPRDLVAVLQADWKAPYRAIVLDGLPVAGVRGTLAGSFEGTPAAGRVFAKTGSMSHVRSLAGFAATQTHGTVAFALMVDDWNGEAPALAAFRSAVLARLVR
jgi:serine-type D-Ala-D-Ala carboxypeptidase/endopeptidase (penicillin-binding protein 4)